MEILEVLAEEAKQEGAKFGLLAFAKKCLNQGMSISTVHECTGLPKSQLIKLNKEPNLLAYLQNIL